MLSEEAEPTLRRMLLEAGVTVDAPTPDDVQRTLTVLRDFADLDVTDADPPEKDGDGLLAQWGRWSWNTYQTDPGSGSREDAFSVDLTRQLSFSVDGDYDHMSQLRCEYHFALTPELEAAGQGNLWSFDLSLDEFFTRVRALPGFAAVRLHQSPPLRLHIHYEQV